MNITLPDTKKHILATLAYFDLFHYPLTMDEIYLYLPVKCDTEGFEHTLRCLVIDRMIYHIDKFYTLKNDHFLIERRIKGNAKAEQSVKLRDPSMPGSTLGLPLMM